MFYLDWYLSYLPERLAGGVRFIPFPKPKTNRDKCLRWIRLCGRPHDKLNVERVKKYTYVCTKHFKNVLGPTEEFPDPLPPNQCTPAKQARKPPMKRMKFSSSQDSSSGPDKNDVTSISKAGESSAESCFVQTEEQLVEEVPKICQWGDCRSNSNKPDTLLGNVTFIPFIKPSNWNRERCMEWIKSCDKSLDVLNIDNIKQNKYICSKHFVEIVNGKPSLKHPDPVSAKLSHSHSQHSNQRCESQPDQNAVEDNNGFKQGKHEKEEEGMVMKLTFDNSGDGISEEIHTSLTRVMCKNETQLCNNKRCVHQTNCLIRELQHALRVERKLKERIQYLLRLTNINLDLLNICVDEKKNPVVKIELDKVYKLKEAILEVHRLFVSEISCDDNDEDTTDEDGDTSDRDSKILEKNWKRSKRNSKDSNHNKLNDSREEMREKQGNGNDVADPIEDSDLKDVDSIMNVVNSCAFKTIEDVDTANSTTSTMKKVDPVKLNSIIPLLDFKDIAMLNVTNLPQGLSLVNNTPVINLNLKDCEKSDLKSPSTCDLSALSNNTDLTCLESTNLNVDSTGMKLNSSSIPILNGPLLNFVNKITSTKIRERITRQRRKKKPLVKKPAESYDDTDNGNDEGSNDDGYTEPTNLDVRPIEDIKPPITRLTRSSTASLKLNDNAGNTTITTKKNANTTTISKSNKHKKSTPIKSNDDKSIFPIKPNTSRSNSNKMLEFPRNLIIKLTDSNRSEVKNRVRSLIKGAKIANKVEKKEKAKPLGKREDLCRGVTASHVMCEVCGKLIACSSTKSWHFQSHMRRVHTGETPERCEICDKRFHDIAALRSHMQYIHSQGRSHQCAVCGKSFKSRENLRKHGLVHTTEGSVYTCTVCNKKFKRSDCLKNHQRIFHKRQHESVMKTLSDPETTLPPPPAADIPPPPPPPLHPQPTPKPQQQLSTSSSSLISSSSSSSNYPSSQPPVTSTSSIPHLLPPEAHTYPPPPPLPSSSSPYLHTPHHPPHHISSSHDILWEGRAVPVPPVHMYSLPGMPMEFNPAWNQHK